MKIIHILYIVSVAAIAQLAAGCSDSVRYRSVEGGVWNTTYHVTYRSDCDMQDSILWVMRQVERSLSPFDSSSLVSAVNRGDSVRVDSLLSRIFIVSQEVNLMSGGAFDPTLAPLVNLWGYGYRSSGVEPTQQAVDSLMMFVGIRDCGITPDGYIRKKHPATEFNFSAITKGYGCDLVGEMLRRNGCEDYMVEIGGEIALSGMSPRGKEWRVMVDAPVYCDTAVVHERMAVVALTGCGVATSGNYRNYRDTGSGRTWHTISTADGRPAVTDLLSATVVAPSCMLADAYATSCMAQTSDAAFRMLESIPGVAGMLVTADTILVTSGFPEIIK